MMQRLFFFLLIGLFSLTIQAQLSTSQQEKLAELVTQKVNTLRKSKKRAPLTRNKELAAAAKLHNTYMVKMQRLSHEERGEDTFKTPRDRVEQFSQDYELIGENILYTTALRTKVTDQMLNKLATNMFRSWRNSPGHYANMIHEDYELADLAFTYNKRDKRIWATHVFGTKGQRIPGQLSEDAFKIERADDETCDQIFMRYDNFMTNLGNAISIEGDEIVLRYHNITTVRAVIKGAKDGVAVDLINREQFPCGEKSILDLSTIYDGILLKPVYRDDLFARNRAKSDYRFIATLGKVPTALQGKELSASLVFIRNGKKCNYTFPASIDSKRYDLRPVEPVILDPDIALKTTGIKEVEEIVFEFKTDATTPIQLPEILKNTTTIKTIEINSYASIDGNKEHNLNLHKARAAYMRRYLGSKLNTSAASWDVRTQENWELFRYQLELMGREDVAEAGAKVMRTYANEYARDTIWQQLFSQQRVSRAVIYSEGQWKAEDPFHGYYNLTNALLDADMTRANKALVQIYNDEHYIPFLSQSFITDKLFDKKELVQNTAALLLKDDYIYDLDMTVFFVRTWLQRADELSEDAQKNLLNLYAITGRRLLKDWDTSSERLAKVIHPAKLESLFANYKSQETVHPLFLNFHMASLDYYSQTNTYENIDVSFDFITQYFKDKAQSLEDNIDLSLFFNSWSRYDLTLNLGLQDYAADKYNEESLFILIKTASAYRDKLDTSVLSELHKKAIRMNKQRWCVWVNNNFQTLRFKTTKELFCKECADIN